MKLRATFPQVYKYLDSKTGNPYFLVSARSRRWGLNERKSFATEKEALEHARQIEKLIQEKGAQPEIPKEKLVMADAYLTLLDKLKPHGKTPQDAVDHYVRFLGEEILRQAKPSVSELADRWRGFKHEDTTLGKKTRNEIDQYWRYIKRTWGPLKPDIPKRNDIEITLKRLKATNNTRRKYLKYVRQFFAWVFNEGVISKNPTDGIFFKPDDFNADFYSVEITKKLLRYVVDKEKDLIGYYALLTFAGLRPTEGARVQWQDFSFKTNELYVRKGKTNARHVILEPVAVEWMKWHRENTPKDAPFVQLRALPNREKALREAVLSGNWIQDGLRHGFATYFKNSIKDIGKVADYMGNSPDMIKRHYARTIPQDECLAFWGLTPAKVLDDEAKKD